jgi:DNA helicase HerA-like ATPase
VLVIEELGAALAQRPTAELIQSLAAQGRSKGLRIIATNQSVSGLPRGLLVNLGNRVVLQGTDDAERLLLGGTSIDRNRGQNQASAQEFRTGAAHVSQVFAASLLPNDQHFEFIRYWST